MDLSILTDVLERDFITNMGGLCQMISLCVYLSSLLANGTKGTSYWAVNRRATTASAAASTENR